jgi:hypothetical protein
MVRFHSAQRLTSAETTTLSQWLVSDVDFHAQPTMAQSTSATIKQAVRDLVSQDDVAFKLKDCITELLANGQDPREHPDALKQKLRDLVTTRISRWQIAQV